MRIFFSLNYLRRLVSSRGSSGALSHAAIELVFCLLGWDERLPLRAQRRASAFAPRPCHELLVRPHGGSLPLHANGEVHWIPGEISHRK